MTHKRSYNFDANGNKADWNFLVEVEFDSSCDIIITNICVWCDVDGYKDWIDQTKEIEARETLYMALAEAARLEVMESEIDQAMDMVEVSHDREIDAYLDSKL
jgi:hypothetical protein